jgi:hypothetical protein
MPPLLAVCAAAGPWLNTAAKAPPISKPGALNTHYIVRLSSLLLAPAVEAG